MVLYTKISAFSWTKFGKTFYKSLSKSRADSITLNFIDGIETENTNENIWGKFLKLIKCALWTDFKNFCTKILKNDLLLHFPMNFFKSLQRNPQHIGKSRAIPTLFDYLITTRYYTQNLSQIKVVQVEHP